MTETKSPFNLFLKVAFAEGISFLILLFIAMPLKYYAGIPEANKAVGMLHGALFVWYSIIIAQLLATDKITFKVSVIAFVLSFIPFGTFFLKRYLPNE